MEKAYKPEFIDDFRDVCLKLNIKQSYIIRKIMQNVFD